MTSRYLQIETIMRHKEVEREGYRYYSQQRKTVSMPICSNPYPVADMRHLSWDDGFDLAAYDDLIGDLEDEL